MYDVPLLLGEEEGYFGGLGRVSMGLLMSSECCWIRCSTPQTVA
ncbi:hypothetical protein ABZ570_27605 [Micromonospora sp. NPDC007271]